MNITKYSSEEWKSYLGGEMGRAMISLFQDMKYEAINNLRGCSDWGDYRKQDGVVDGIELLLEELNELQRGEANEKS